MAVTKELILGGGIAGLIWAYYNKGLVISPEFGGQMSSHFPLGPRYLHNTSDSIKFLLDLGIVPKLRIIKVGYWDDKTSKVLDKIPNKTFVKKYFEKSRGGAKLNDATAMSSKLSSFEVLEVDFNEIIERLVAHLGAQSRLLIDSVKAIDFVKREVLLQSEKTLSYDTLVSTIPLNVFLKISGLPCNLKSSPITYVWTKNTMPKTEYDYIYVPDQKILHHRITFDEKGQILDVYGHHTKEKMAEHYGEHFIDCYTLWNAQIISIDEPPCIEGVKFVGRYGTWCREWKTEKVIEEAKKNGR